VLNVPDAFARSAGATRLTTAWVVGRMAGAIPTPASVIGARSQVYATSGAATNAIQVMPTAVASAPATISTRSPGRAASAAPGTSRRPPLSIGGSPRRQVFPLGGSPASTALIWLPTFIAITNLWVRADRLTARPPGIGRGLIVVPSRQVRRGLGRTPG